MVSAPAPAVPVVFGNKNLPATSNFGHLSIMPQSGNMPWRASQLQTVGLQTALGPERSLFILLEVPPGSSFHKLAGKSKYWRRFLSRDWASAILTAFGVKYQITMGVAEDCLPSCSFRTAVQHVEAAPGFLKSPVLALFSAMTAASHPRPFASFVRTER